MKGTLLVCVLSVFILGMCDENKKGASMQTEEMPVTDVSAPDDVALGQPIPFVVTCGTPTPCWEFKEVRVTQKGLLYSITVIAQYDGRPCVQVLGSFKARSSVVPREKGSYILRFKRAEGDFIERSVVVR